MLFTEKNRLIFDTVVEMSENGFHNATVPQAILALHTKDPQAYSHLPTEEKVSELYGTFFPYAVAIWMGNNLDTNLVLSEAVRKFDSFGLDGTESIEIMSHLKKHFPDSAEHEYKKILEALYEVRSAKGAKADIAIAKVRQITSIPRHLMNCLLLSTVRTPHGSAFGYKYFTTLQKVLDDIQVFFIDGNPVASAGRLDKFALRNQDPNNVTFSQDLALVADRGAALVVQKYITYTRLEHLLQNPSDTIKRKLEMSVLSLQPATSSYNPSKSTSSKTAALLAFHGMVD